MNLEGSIDSCWCALLSTFEVVSLARRVHNESALCVQIRSFFVSARHIALKVKMFRIVEVSGGMLLSCCFRAAAAKPQYVKPQGNNPRSNLPAQPLTRLAPSLKVKLFCVHFLFYFSSTQTYFTKDHAQLRPNSMAYLGGLAPRKTSDSR
jgi:hypothetical protein